MARRSVALVLSTFVLAGIGMGSTRANDETDCTGSPSEAVMTLPAPLSKWGEVACTPFGHVLTSRKGWAWVLISAKRPVILPSQMVDEMPQPLGNKSYFTAIAVQRVTGQEFAAAYETLHGDLDPHETLPNGYRVDLASVSGKKMLLYFFDYDTYAWAIECPNGSCSRGSRFMILDQDHMPTPRGPSI